MESYTKGPTELSFSVCLVEKPQKADGVPHLRQRAVMVGKGLHRREGLYVKCLCWPAVHLQ